MSVYISHQIILIFPPMTTLILAKVFATTRSIKKRKPPGAWRPSQSLLVNREDVFRWKVLSTLPSQYFTFSEQYFTFASSVLLLWPVFYSCDNYCDLIVIDLLRGWLNQLSSLSVSVGLSSIWPWVGFWVGGYFIYSVHNVFKEFGAKPNVRLYLFQPPPPHT